MSKSSFKYIVIVAVFAQFLCNNFLYYAQANTSSKAHASPHAGQESSQSAPHECPVNKIKVCIRNADTFVDDGIQNKKDLSGRASMGWAAFSGLSFSISLRENVPGLPISPPPIKDSYNRKLSTVLLM